MKKAYQDLGFFLTILHNFNEGSFNKNRFFKKKKNFFSLESQIFDKNQKNFIKFSKNCTFAIFQTIQNCLMTNFFTPHQHQSKSHPKNVEIQITTCLL